MNGNGAWQRGLRILNPDMIADDGLLLVLGRSDDLRNMGYMSFKYDNDASDYNRLSFGLYAVNDVLNVMGNGRVGIGTTNLSAKFTLSGVSGTLNHGESAVFIQNSNQYFDFNGGMIFRGSGSNWNSRFTATANLEPNNEVVGIYKHEATAGDVLNDASGVIAVFKNNGHVGIGLTDPDQGLVVVDTIRSALGGFQFLDGTVQTTAAGSGGVISINDLSDAKYENNDNYSTTMGSNIETNGTGSFAIGDNSSVTDSAFTTANRFYARFANGYRLYTSATLSTGAEMQAGQNSWSVISDSTKKENFKAADGEKFLDKISRFNLTSWNYKGQDSARFRHYGPMAQDFYAAFGHDGIGTIGNDTTIASADFDGINFIAIQALEKRTTQLKEKLSEIENLKSQLAQLQNENQKIREEFINLQGGLVEFRKQFVKFQQEHKKSDKQASASTYTTGYNQ